MLIRLGLAVNDKILQTYLAQKLSDYDIRVEVFKPPKTAWQKVRRSGCDVIVISESLVLHPMDSGIAILNELPENPLTVIIHESDSPEEHAQLAAAGADVVLYAGISKKSMIEAIETSIEARRQFIQRKRFDRTGLSEPKITDFVSESRAMQIFMEEVQQVIASDSPILLMGETGVGKEHLAKAIHAESPRSAGPFISVNTAAMPEQLLESELFGHEQGAFTGAVRYRRGAFELAHSGTIFLDEIGEMPLHLQAKLLRVLQDYEVKPIGGETPIQLDVRVIAATNSNLEEEIAKGNFRQNLYYRLSVLSLTIPPLRNRSEDIPAMVRRFIVFYRYRIGRDINGVSNEALQAMCSYDWPGNVRELMNVLERAMLLSKTGEIAMADLPHVFNGSTPAFSATVNGLTLDTSQWSSKTLAEAKKEVLDQVERLYLEKVLVRTRGRIDQTAQIASIHPRGLYNIMKKLGLRKEQFKD
jgi:DNA-binding NtrC family response regulator